MGELMWRNELIPDFLESFGVFYSIPLLLFIFLFLSLELIL